ncbi:MAG TPA: ATP-binding protein [Mycobacteriales bacterium]
MDDTGPVGTDPFETDPFDTEAIRRRVLDAWAASPARFREDANAEDDLVHGAYRDRVLVELAQNAADAAGRAGLRGALRLTVEDGDLRAANTGTPLDAAGVQALATLRASAKRDAGTVGRFGVGFSAVRTVTDEPAVVSRSGGVRFSAEATRREVAAVPALAAELGRRHGRVPVLRLPWPASGEPPEGFDTEVRLPLRPDAVPAVLATLAEIDPVLLLALPTLGTVDAGGRVLSRVDGPDGTVTLADGPASTTWRVVSAAGTLPAELLAGRPAEERDRPEWTVSWAVPVDAAGVPVQPIRRPVVHAPTPTDEPLSLPAVLLGSFPLASDRRHVTPGPITDLLVAAAARAYAELVSALPPTPALLDLVPRPALAAAPLDTALTAAALDALRATSWLPPAAPEEPGDRVTPAEAVVVDAAGPELVSALADLVPGLLPAEWSGRGRAAPLSALGVRRLSTADVVELVSGVDRPPAWWRDLYAALADAPDREALAGLRVPLADGRTVTGVRGVLLPDADLPAAAASALGLRVVHPDAAHPVLERLGAQPATARGTLADDRVRAAVEASLDAEDPEPVAEAVLALVAGARPAPGELPWLAELALPGQDGDWYPAGELLLPGSPLERVLTDDAPYGRVAAGLAGRWGAETLTATGVLTTFPVLVAADVELDPDAYSGYDLDGEDDWLDAVLDRLPEQAVPPRLSALVAVRDLDLVADDRWPEALALLDGLDGIAPTAELTLAGGTRVEVPSYTTWWLSTHPTLGGRRPDRLRAPEAADLAGLYDVAPDAPAVAGANRGLEDVLADPDRARELLDRLGDPARTVTGPTLRTVYARLATVGTVVPDADPPERVRTAPDRTVDRDDAVLLDLPHLLPLLAGRTPVPAADAPGPVADLLDLPLASELVPDSVPDTTPERWLRWADVPGAGLAAERCGGTPPATDLAVHAGLTVGGVPVAWWPGDGMDHVDADADAAVLGRALAWRLDAWPARAAAAEALADPAAEDLLRAEDAAG